jgi:hypothetical protein
MRLASMRSMSDAFNRWVEEIAEHTHLSNLYRFEPTPHAWIQMPLHLLIIHFLIDSKQLIHERTEAYEIGAFERFEVVDTAMYPI